MENHTSEFVGVPVFISNFVRDCLQHSTIDSRFFGNGEMLGMYSICGKSVLVRQICHVFAARAPKGVLLVTETGWNLNLFGDMGYGRSLLRFLHFV